jgi:hypothetical protein
MIHESTSVSGPCVPNGRIYVICPGGAVSGGPELLHQLVHQLNACGRDAFITYVPADRAWDTPAPYARYGCPVARYASDEIGVAVVVPETSTRVLRTFRRATHVVWWLSVDNYRGRLEYGPAGWKVLLRRTFLSDIPSPRLTVHLFQSAYAREFVGQRFGTSGQMLSDYLAAEFLTGENIPAAVRVASVGRRKAVAYNPSKGMAFTTALMRANPTIEFVPLRGMTREQVRSTLETCAVYVDFGHHPGKDRIPREAAMCGAVVIVGRNGSACYAEDVPISDCYKIRPSLTAVREAGALIEQIFAAYPEHYAAQAPYRDAIAQEPERFRVQVRTIFGVGLAR